MNNKLLRRQHSITADRQPVTRSRVELDGGGRPLQSSNVFRTNAMATSVALLERFQQPTAVPTTSPTAAMDGGDRLLYRHHRPHHHSKYNSVSAGSALSKSMRYADGWLYERNGGGTVGHGGGGGRNKTRSTFLGREHFGAAAAVVRTAVTPPTPQPSSFSAVATSTTPAHAVAAEDPYDRVRKNRMAGAATAAGKPDRKRRNRSDSSRTPSPDYDDTGGGRVTTSRRSILECNVNPYDLLRPSDDDDDCPKRMSLKDKFMNRIQDTVFTAKNKQGSPTSSNGFAALKKTASADRNGGVNIAGHTVSEILL